MTTAIITERIAQSSPRFKAQDFGAPGFRAQGFRTSGLKTKSAGVIYLLSILAAAFGEIFVRGGLSIAGGLFAVSAMIAVTLLFYGTLNSASRSLAVLAASFNLVGLAVEVLRLQPHGANIAVVFDGFFCILIGYLAFRSSYVARLLAAFIVLGGLGWLTFLSSPIAHALSPYNLALGILGEGSVCLWLLLAGADVGKQPSIAANAVPSSETGLIRVQS
jgi:hypothetical protein